MDNPTTRLNIAETPMESASTPLTGLSPKTKRPGGLLDRTQAWSCRRVLFNNSDSSPYSPGQDLPFLIHHQDSQSSTSRTSSPMDISSPGCTPITHQSLMNDQTEPLTGRNFIQTAMPSGTNALREQQSVRSWETTGPSSLGNDLWPTKANGRMDSLCFPSADCYTAPALDVTMISVDDQTLGHSPNLFKPVRSTNQDHPNRAYQYQELHQQTWQQALKSMTPPVQINQHQPRTPTPKPPMKPLTGIVMKILMQDRLQSYLQQEQELAMTRAIARCLMEVEEILMDVGNTQTKPFESQDPRRPNAHPVAGVASSMINTLIAP